MKNDVYRQAASVLVLKPAGQSYELLLLHKPRKRDAWQLPQGGMEPGESVEQAAMRELAEEAGLRECRVLGVSAQEYRYDFPASYRRFRPDNVCGQRIRFACALAPPDAHVAVDRREVDRHVWVGLRDLGKYIKRKEYVELVRTLYEEAVDYLR